MIRWNPAKRPSAQQALRYPYFQSGTNKQPNGHIMEQTLQRSYARKAGMLHHQVTPPAINYSDLTVCTLQPGDSGPEDVEEVVVDLKGKAGRSRRSSSLGAGSALPHIHRVRSGGQLGPGGAGGAGGTVVSPVPGYKQQLYSERSSPVERHRSPSAGPNGRVNWKAKYLK